MRKVESNIDISEDKGRVVVHNSSSKKIQFEKPDYTGPLAALGAVFLGIVIWMVWDNVFAKPRRKKKKNKNKKDGFLTTLPYQIQNPKRR